MGIGEEDLVEVLGLGHRMSGWAHIDESVPPGVITTTSLFGQLVSDFEVSEEIVPASRLPGLDIRPVRIFKTGS